MIGYQGLPGIENEHMLKDRHVVPGGEQLDILGHMAKREALIISASIINTDVLQLLLIVGYFPMQ